MLTPNFKCLALLLILGDIEKIPDEAKITNCGSFHLFIICSGVVKSKRSIWRLKTITDFFWAIVNFFGVFFATMFSVILIFFPHFLMIYTTFIKEVLCI